MRLALILLCLALSVLLLSGGASVENGSSWFESETVSTNLELAAVMSTTVHFAPQVVLARGRGIIVAAEEQDLAVPNDLGLTFIREIAPEGTQVKKGDVVLRLSTQSLESNERLFRTKLASKRAELARQMRQDEVEIERLRDALRQSRASYDESREQLRIALLGGDPLEIERLENQVVSSRLGLKDAKRKLAVKEALARKGHLSDLELAESRGAAETARIELARAQNLLDHERAGPSPAVLERLESLVSQFESEVELAEEEVRVRKRIQALEAEKGSVEVRSQEAVHERWKRKLSQADLTAPTTGVVVHAANMWGGGRFTAGSRVWSGMRLMKIARTDRLQVKLMVSERMVEPLEVGQKARVHILGARRRSLAATVESISSIAVLREASDPKGAKDFAVILQLLDEGLGELKLNLPVDVEIETASFPRAARLPRDVVFPGPGGEGYLVHRVTLRGLEPVALTIAASDDDYYYVTAGLDEGDRLSFLPSASSGGDS